MREASAKLQDLEHEIDSSWQEKLEAALVSIAEKQGRDFLAPRGLLSLFERTKTMHGFDLVYASWRPAYVSYMVRMRFKKLSMATTLHERARELFFCRLVGGQEPGIALREYAPLIYDRARSGDMDFFKRISHEPSKRHRRIYQRKHPAMALLSAWLHGFLWLLSSRDRLTVIEQFGFQGKVTLKGLELCRKRLRLIGWADFGRDHYPQAPLKLDYSPEHGFRLILLD
jgi:hypothetical protein